MIAGLRRRLLLAVAAAAGLPGVWAQQPAAAKKEGAAKGLELVVLGSGGPGATGRAGAGYLVLVDGGPRLLVDAGPGTFARLGDAGLSLAKVDTVLLTHLHVDHAGELPGLVKARAVGAGGPIAFRVFGPGGSLGGGERARFPSTTAFVDGLFGARGVFAYLKDFASPVRFKVTAVTTRGRNPAPKQLLDDNGLTVHAISGHHGDAPAVVYRVAHGGKSITFSGDIDATGHAALLKLAQGSTLLVFNAVVLDPPGSAKVLYGLHTSPAQIGELAAKARVGRLLLSHVSPAVEQAQKEVMASVRAHYQGPVGFANDGQRLAP